MSEKICWCSPLGRGKWPFYKRVKFRSGKRLSRASIAFFFFSLMGFVLLFGWLVGFVVVNKGMRICNT